MTERIILPIRCIIADDHALLRDGLQTMLRKTREIEMLGECADGKELLTMAASLGPDIVITDIEMPVMNGIAAARALTSQFPHIGIIALTMFGEDNLVIDMLEAGARGYLLKTSAKQEIIEAIHAVHQGETYYCRSTSAKLARMIAESKFHPHRKKQKASFSSREKEIIQLICQQFSNKEVASLLNLSIRTIETHRERIQEKMGVRNAAGIVIYAIKNGLYKL